MAIRANARAHATQQVHSIKLKAPAENAPSSLKLFVNPGSIDFDDGPPRQIQPTATCRRKSEL